MENNPLISVIMPVNDQLAFLPRAISSLEKQTYRNWELILIDDGSREIISVNYPYLRNIKNEGLGYTLNRALEKAKGEWIAYLPADDAYYPEHLESLIHTSKAHDDATLIYSSIKHHYNNKAAIVGDYFQLVQVMHKHNGQRWKERAELESDHLGWLFFDAFIGPKIHTGMVSCEWTDHPHQRHKKMQEPIGGINPFREYYQIQTPLRFHSSCGHLIDEQKKYAYFRNNKYPEEKNGLKILLLGELAYNAERILALKEKGHQLYGLWMEEPYWYNSIGPMPFGHIQEIKSNEINALQPDIIYALLNWQAIPFIYEIISKHPAIPYCFHFKEGPFICIEKGSWNELIYLYQKAAGRIYCSVEMKEWFDQFLPPSSFDDLILDGDLPKKDWFTKDRSNRLSNTHDEFHTVVPGRPIGIHPKDMGTLAAQNIHLHFYGEFTHGQWLEWIKSSLALAPDHLHIHPNVEQEDWVTEFSKYDAGWLHIFQSENYGNLIKANWDDLNIPARMATLAQAGLPMIQWNNDGHSVAIQSIAKEKQLSLFINSFEHLGEQLAQKKHIDALRNAVWQQRSFFTFDHHVERLIEYFHSIKTQQYNHPKNKSPLNMPW